MTRAFSLTEVLIAVLILALGMLGLAAVYPVVISEQRAARDQTQGSLAYNTVKLFIERGGFLEGGFEVLRNDEFFSIGPNASSQDPDDYRPAYGAFLWEAGYDWRGLPSWVQRRYLDQGLMILRTGTEIVPTPPPPPPGGVLAGSTPVPQHQRVFPFVNGGSDPESVWDAVIRRVPTEGVQPWVLTDRPKMALQVAVFLRRIDQGAMAKTNYPNNIVASTSGSPEALCLSINRNGRPDFTGAIGNRSAYSLILDLIIEVVEPDDRNAKASDVIRLIESPSGDLSSYGKPIGTIDNEGKVRFLSKPGQQFIDNFGQVYRVIEVEENGDLVIDPPIQRSRWEDTVQAIFTPQTPIRAFVMSIPGGGA
ncbi:MAG: hypothetical protein KDA28_11110 [Phycisphaerales bacterium]|nr:hypothetical protein [Phycisphaerales bacterium]